MFFRMIVLLLIFILLHSSMLFSFESDSVQTSRTRDEILAARITELEARKAELQSNMVISAVKDSFDRAFDDRLIFLAIQRYETLQSQCEKNRSHECGDTIYTLANLYYEQERKKYIQKREQYEKDMDIFEKDTSLPEPQNPVPDYTRALSFYERIIERYPTCSCICNTYYILSKIYLFQEEYSRSKSTEYYLLNYCQDIKLSDFERKGCSNRDKLHHIESLQPNDIHAEMIHFRTAELYFELKEDTIASELFNSYVKECGSGIYAKTAMYELALKYLKILEKNRNRIKK